MYQRTQKEAYKLQSVIERRYDDDDVSNVSYLLRFQFNCFKVMEALLRNMFQRCPSFDEVEDELNIPIC